MAVGGNPVFNGKNFNTQVRGSRMNRGSLATQSSGQMTPQQLQELYTAPSAGPSQTGRMTYDDVIMKTLACLAVVLVGAAIPMLVLQSAAGPLMIIGALGGFVLGLVNSFKREPSPALILAYAALEGLFLGGLTLVLDNLFPGIGLQAVLGTLSVFAVTLVLFKSGKVRATPKAMRFFMIAMIGYAVFSLVNVGMMIFGATDTMFGMRDSITIMGIPLGVLVGLLAVGLAAFSLIVDFTSIEQGVQAGAPVRYSWTAAFGLTVTLVWLYVEILRILAILRGDD